MSENTCLVSQKTEHQPQSCIAHLGPTVRTFESETKSSKTYKHFPIGDSSYGQEIQYGLVECYSLKYLQTMNLS